MNNINIAELLKDCPKGTKLYSTIFGEVELKEVKDNGRSVCIFVTNFYGQEEMFYPDGKYNTHYSDSECTLFPSKEQRDWSKFCPFKDGDVLSDGGRVFIFNRRRFDKGIGSYVYNFHCVLAPNKRLYVNSICFEHVVDVVSFATEEEKQKLFQAIKDNGYRWNEETKTLENLPKFKDGDILFVESVYNWIIIYKESEDDEKLHKYVAISDNPKSTLVFDNHLNGLCYKEEISKIRFATEEEKDKLFSVIKDKGYRWNAETKTLEKEEKKDKFDIATLKPFDKVLVRYSNDDPWIAAHFSHYLKYSEVYYPYFASGSCFKLCIPYEGNEHLLGTTNDCDEYYKTWNA